MDNDSIGAMKMLASLYDTAVSFGRLSSHLRKNAAIAAVSTAVEPFNSSTDAYPQLEAYVDVEFQGNKNITWHLNVHIDKEWLIDCYIAESNQDGEHRIKSLGTRNAQTLDDFVSALHASTVELVSSASAFDFSPYVGTHDE